MKRGDLIRYTPPGGLGPNFWLVHRVDSKRSRTAEIKSRSGHTLEIPHDSADVEVLANPSTDWPFVVIPEKARWGPVVLIERMIGPTVHLLVSWEDYMLSDPARCGGPVFLRPNSQAPFQVGDALSIHHENARAVRVQRVTIPGNFATFRQRTARVKKEPVKERTSYDHLLADTFNDDEP